MTTLVAVDARIKAESLNAMRALLAEILPDTRTYEGNRGITAYLNEDGQSCLLLETWESKAHYEKYLGWRRETGVLDRITSLLDGEPDIRYFETIDA